jgi:hypothetical protein
MSFHSSAVTLSGAEVPRCRGAEVPSVPLVPATFWQRLAAALIDFALTGLVVASLGNLCAISKALADVFVVPLALFAFVYSSVGHALYGRTVGKHLLKIRVVRLDGTRIGWNYCPMAERCQSVTGFRWWTPIFSSSGVGEGEWVLICRVDTLLGWGFPDGL